MHKELLILGMLRDGGSTSGYDLHRIVRAHGELFRDLKKPNMYHLLDRLARDGHLSVRRQPGARGRRGEKLLYSLTASGKRRFRALLSEEVRTYETVYTGVEVGMVFLRQLPRASALRLMRSRRDAIKARRQLVAAAFGDVSSKAALTRIAADHLLSLIDAELAWAERALKTLGRDYRK